MQVIKYGKLISDVEPRHDHLFVLVHGHMNLEDAKLVTLDILEEAIKYQLSNIIIDSSPTKGKFSFLEVYDYSVFIAYYVGKAVGKRKISSCKIVYLERNPLVYPYKIAEKVSKEKGLDIKVTSSYEEALKFLQIKETSNL